MELVFDELGRSAMIEMGLAEFAIKLTEVALEAMEAERHALEKAAKLVENEAKSRVGHYQEAIGPFAGWAELADSTKADRVNQGFTENDPGLRTGEMRDSIEHKTEEHEAQIGSNNDKLVWFELGTSKQPPRAVLGGAACAKEAEVVSILGDGVVTALIGAGVHGGKFPISR